MGSEKNHYQILDISRDATQEEIRSAYRRKVREHHPDAQPSLAGDPGSFLAVQQAFETLSNPEKRKLYDASLPAEEELIQVSTIFNRSSLIKIKEPQLLFILMDIQAPPQAKKIAPSPINVALVLDQSTSMKGTRLDLVKSAARRIVNQLRPQDILSIVAFSDKTRVIQPASTQRDFHKIEHNIQMLQASGGTEIYKGLAAGFDEVKRYAHPKYVNHILLLTDGRTYGDEDLCLNLAKKAANLGIGISGLGVGLEWNDQFIDRLVAISGGEAIFVESTRKIEEFLTQKFRRLANIYAHNVQLTYTSDPEVTLNYAFRILPDAAPVPPENDVLRFGNVPVDRPLRILFEFLVSSIPEKANEVVLMKGRVNLIIPGMEQTQISQRIELVLPAIINPTREQVPEDIITALSQVTLYRLHEKAVVDIDNGDIDMAVERLENLATHLLIQGQSELARSVLIEAKNVSKTHALSLDGNKRIKYGTRSLMLPSQSEDPGK
jgi:Ca-activated chloride channel family protein